MLKYIYITTIISPFIWLFINLNFYCSISYAAEDPPFRARWPMINKEIEIGGRGFRTYDNKDELDGNSKQRYGFGMGVTDNFFFEIEGEYEKESEENKEFKAYEIDTRYEITQTKDWKEKPNPLDIGVSLGVSFPESNEDSYEIESRLLLYKNFGTWKTTGNFILEQEFDNSSDSGLELAYSGQYRYKITPNIQPGFELFGRFGELNDIAIGNEQHKFGPGLFGFVEFTDNYGLKYEIGWLVGYTDPTPKHSFKWLIEFEYKY